ncbi:MAG TPA: serine protease [Candidatus Obscuribacterales bacterium]
MPSIPDTLLNSALVIATSIMSAGFASPVASSAATSSAGHSMVPQQVATHAMASTVSVYVYDKHGLPGGHGSGFFAAPEVLVTNYHVIENGTAGFIRFAGVDRRYRIQAVLAVDTSNDLALLYVPGTRAPSLVLGRDNAVRVGDRVYAVGAPLDLPLSVTPGYISNLSAQGMLQMTAPISPGNSGGPLLDEYGRVIGIVRAFYPGGQNLNLAIKVGHLEELLARIAR